MIVLELCCPVSSDGPAVPASSLLFSEDHPSITVEADNNDVGEEGLGDPDCPASVSPTLSFWRSLVEMSMWSSTLWAILW